MKRALLLLALLLPAAPCPAQEPVAAPIAPAAAERVEARRAALLEETKELAARLSERAVCALLPVTGRGLPSFKSDARGNLSLDATVQIDLAAYRAWVAEISPRLRRLARRVESFRLVKDPRGYRVEAPGREFDASQLVVVDGFSDIPRSLGAHVYTFDIATATELRAALRPAREKKNQTCVLVQFRGPAGPVASVRQPFAFNASPESVAPFVEWRIRYQRIGSGAQAQTFPILSFKSRKPLRFSLGKTDTSVLRTMDRVWTACLSNEAADAAATSDAIASFRDARGRVVRPARAAVEASAGSTAEDTVPFAAEEEERRRAAEARALRLQAESATADAVRAGAEAFFASVRGGARGKVSAAAVEAFEVEDLSVACTEAVRDHPGTPELQVAGEAYLASQLWAKWRMRAKIDEAGGIVPVEPTWSLAPSFQPPEYIRGASRANPFPALSLDDPGSAPLPPPATSFPFGPFLLALCAIALFAGTIVLLWIERMRKKAEETPGGE